MDCAFVVLEGTGQTNAYVQSSVESMAVPGYTMSCFIESLKKNRPFSIPTPEEPPIQHSQPEPLVEGSHVMQATSNKSRVLLQVVPLTLYGPCGQLNAHALLDPGGTC